MQRTAAISRTDRGWGDRFPAIAEAVEAVEVSSCLEVIACRDDGLADFELLRYRRCNGPVMLVAFDLNELDGLDLRRRPIEERKAELARLLDGCQSGIVINRVFDHPAPLVVSKRRGSRYVAGRSDHWIKVKNPDAPAVPRKFEEGWTRSGRRGIHG